MLGLAVLAICGVLAPLASAEESLPPVSVTYAGELHETVHRTTHLPEDAHVNLSWTATGSANGTDGGLPLTWTSLSGSVIDEYSNGCQEYNRSYSLPHENPQPAGWSLGENLEYPQPGWKYVISTLNHLHTHESYVFNPCNGNETLSFDEPEDKLLEISGYVSEARSAELDAIFEPVEVPPGVAMSVPREFKSNETVECTCLPDPTHVELQIKFTVSVNSPPPGNVVEPPPPPKTNTEPPTTTTQPPKVVSEARRKEIKEQARADLGPALREDWAAHGLSAGFGMAAAGALSAAADELGQTAARFEGNDANVRVINDYRIIKDPPRSDYHLLAEPAAAKPETLPSCARFHGRRSRYCKTLRAAETTLLAQAGQVATIDEALDTTISRDTAAFDAGNYAAAEVQASHFESLRSQFDSALNGQAKAGARVAALLREAHVKGTATKTQVGKAIDAVEHELGRSGITRADLEPLAGSALKPQKTNLLDILAQA